MLLSNIHFEDKQQPLNFKQIVNVKRTKYKKKIKKIKIVSDMKREIENVCTVL